MKSGIARTVLSLAIVALYIAGLVMMFMQRVQPALWLWVISTAGGVGLLYYIRVMNKRAEDAEKIARGMPYGEPDDPTAPQTPVAPTSTDADGKDDTP